jgi:hypothetical protein
MAVRATRIAAAFALLYAARRYYRNWGTTKDECQMGLPGDELAGRPAVRSTEGVWIDASADAVWPLLQQIGRDPGDLVHLAPRGWLGRHNRLALRVVEVIDNEAIVLRGAPPVFPWDAVWSLHLFVRGDNRCRLLLRTRALLRHPGEVLATELAGPVTALIARRMLLGIKHSAECHRVRS